MVESAPGSNCPGLRLSPGAAGVVVAEEAAVAGDLDLNARVSSRFAEVVESTLGFEIGPVDDSLVPRSAGPN